MFMENDFGNDLSNPIGTMSARILFCHVGRAFGEPI